MNSEQNTQAIASCDPETVQQQLRESEEKYRLQFEQAMDAIFLADGDTGILVDCNQAALKLIGRDRSEVIGQHQRMLHPPSALQGQFTDTFRKHLSDGDGAVLETQVITRRGDLRDVAIKASVLHIGGKTLVQGIFRDVTESNRKTQAMARIQQELLSASRRAGMAEMATDILHNVGNVLNSINVSATLIQETMSNSEIPNLKKVSDMIESHLEDLGEFLQHDPQGQYIPSYLIKAGELLSSQQHVMLEQLGALAEDVDHIKNVIQMQQDYVRGSQMVEPTTIDQIVDDAIRINSSGLVQNGIRIDRSIDDLGTIMLNRQRVAQVLVNLISNAKYALIHAECSDKVLGIQCRKGNGNRFSIEVTDNGVGIASEHMTKIFQHGFTTKKDGHGFGLHSGALVAKEMNGSLTAHSEGPGHGATFTLELPFKPTGVK